MAVFLSLFCLRYQDEFLMKINFALFLGDPFGPSLLSSLPFYHISFVFHRLFAVCFMFHVVWVHFVVLSRCYDKHSVSLLSAVCFRQIKQSLLHRSVLLSFVSPYQILDNQKSFDTLKRFAELRPTEKSQALLPWCQERKRPVHSRMGSSPEHVRQFVPTFAIFAHHCPMCRSVLLNHTGQLLCVQKPKKM